jgi:hypothetical protein
MQRAVIQFLYPEQTRARQRWWLIIDNGTADLCSVDPGFDVDLYVRSDLRTMTQIWMGLTTVAAEESAGRLIYQETIEWAGAISAAFIYYLLRGTGIDRQAGVFDGVGRRNG